LRNALHYKKIKNKSFLRQWRIFLLTENEGEKGTSYGLVLCGSRASDDFKGVSEELWS